jgi:hypothetical protein
MQVLAAAQMSPTLHAERRQQQMPQQACAHAQELCSAGAADVGA